MRSGQVKQLVCVEQGRSAPRDKRQDDQKRAGERGCGKAPQGHAVRVGQGRPTPPTQRRGALERVGGRTPLRHTVSVEQGCSAPRQNGQDALRRASERRSGRTPQRCDCHLEERRSLSDGKTAQGICKGQSSFVRKDNPNFNNNMASRNPWCYFAESRTHRFQDRVISASKSQELHQVRVAATGRVVLRDDHRQRYARRQTLRSDNVAKRIGDP